MARFATTIKAVDPQTNELLTWSGPVIEARTWNQAIQYCQENGLGYCKVSAIIRETPVLNEADTAEVAEAMQ